MRRTIERDCLEGRENTEKRRRKGRGRRRRTSLEIKWEKNLDHGCECQDLPSVPSVIVMVAKTMIMYGGNQVRCRMRAPVNQAAKLRRAAARSSQTGNLHDTVLYCIVLYCSVT
jgi:hypothetical protein